MLSTPFEKFHEQHGAKMVDFAGWRMPLHYGSITAEHKQCRQSGALFDVSHMGRIEIKGRHARKFCERVLTRKVSDMPVKTARYALICNEAGGVMDDVLVYRFEDHFLLVVNASNRQKVLDHLHRTAEAESMVVRIGDVTKSTAMIAVQGPRVMEKIGGFSKEIPTLKRYAFTTKNLMILKMHVSRTGYTGEDGVEIMMGANMAGMAIKLLLKDAGEADALVKPAGLGARDTLRLEAGMPLYGHELSEETDPLSAGLGFGVSLDKDQPVDGQPPVPRFIGQDSLEQIHQDGPAKRLVGLLVEGPRTPRQDAAVLRDAAPVGLVTSGCHSPTLDRPIAMAYVDASAAGEGTRLAVRIGAEGEAPATVTALPFVRRG
ncbi:glycine cleavage system aminomethyltransferase GcvT [Phycisphaera mikurensis]|uniref:aminomethyltransferase n=1 Tax=Phycisphaera mikurensis (strain NBRC 102666 / KCTC 22515 / FYK2301M01) TaxID=1142394 RepID=I0IG96_PHYMF|nr:glycine cleavage system aminomethyltransferase GcvT [Phycisphaera mikurensis]MBB6440334.1 aminomethyltransferase [Phycisphaera mikurensis]BAM04284.1 aminomethyltransferase [Phycisphaera mikurensis NBRC 102666]